MAKCERDITVALEPTAEGKNTRGCSLKVLEQWANPKMWRKENRRAFRVQNARSGADVSHCSKSTHQGKNIKKRAKINNALPLLNNRIRALLR